jgi:hypothetical protein
LFVSLRYWLTGVRYAIGFSQKATPHYLGRISFLGRALKINFFVTKNGFWHGFKIIFRNDKASHTVPLLSVQMMYQPIPLIVMAFITH